MDFFPTVLIAFPKTDLDFTDCCMNLFSTMTMFMFLCKYDRPSIILFVVFPSPLKRRSTQSSSCLISAIITASVSSLSTCQMVPAPSPQKSLTCIYANKQTIQRGGFWKCNLFWSSSSLGVIINIIRL